MKITVSPEKCTGHARCNATAPEVYELDDDGYCSLRELDVPAELEQPAKSGAEACPERAITLT